MTAISRNRTFLLKGLRIHDVNFHSHFPVLILMQLSFAHPCTHNCPQTVTHFMLLTRIYIHLLYKLSARMKIMAINRQND